MHNFFSDVWVTNSLQYSNCQTKLVAQSVCESKACTSLLQAKTLACNCVQYRSCIRSSTSQLGQSQREFSTRSGLVKYSLLGMFFCPLLFKGRLYTIIFCCSTGSQFDAVNVSENSSSGVQFVGGIPTKWAFLLPSFQVIKGHFSK